MCLDRELRVIAMGKCNFGKGKRLQIRIQQMHIQAAAQRLRRPGQDGMSDALAKTGFQFGAPHRKVNAKLTAHGIGPANGRKSRASD